MNSRERLGQIRNMIREARSFQCRQEDVITNSQMFCILVALDEILEELQNPVERLEELKRREPFRSLFLS